MNQIHHTAIIYSNVILGENVYIGPYCIIGSNPEWKGREQDNKGVIIQSGTTITGMVTIDGGAITPTEIGANCYIMKHVHIGHDAVIKDNVTISCGAKIGGHTTVDKNCNIGLNAVVHQKCYIPEGCMIGASAFVGKTSILKPFHKYAGVPVRELGPNIKS